MGTALDTIGSIIGLILVTILAWGMYTLLIMIVLAGLFTIIDVVAQYVMVGISLPDWWKITLVISGVIGAFEFYENIVRNP